MDNHPNDHQDQNSGTNRPNDPSDAYDLSPKEKRDLQDFLIAIAVIAFFLLMGAYLLGGCDKDLIPEAPIADIVDVDGTAVDTDADGIVDEVDACPAVVGVAGNAGCPAEVSDILQ